ncbi:hypothetical protein [Acinetobacter chinensis]|uniref:hypothetical protein n=1 Tax=Acinetobacter chinensis TaxID=2004650 RepID=UPI002934B372|nr:hypothetical protein [Acinetobacter chinensis]WOE42839.1 hypothetical protein QSG87_06875 [Acinetobacter chinensis]
MVRTLFYSVVSTVIFLSGCASINTGLGNIQFRGQANQPEQKIKIQEQQLQQAVYAYTQTTAQYDFALTDLNADAVDDAVVLLKGMDWCGSGGCTLLIFKGTALRFDLVSKTTLVNTPVDVSDKPINGWKSLSVYSKGTGNVLLKFDGQTYPGNPSMIQQDKEQKQSDLQILIKD